MKRFKYKIVEECDADIELLGEAGWELVSVVFKHYMGGRNGFESETVYYFKKEI